MYIGVLVECGKKNRQAGRQLGEWEVSEKENDRKREKEGETETEKNREEETLMQRDTKGRCRETASKRAVDDG